MNSTDADDLLFLYAAGALDDSEREQVATLLASMPDQVERLAQAELEVAQLAAAQPAVAPDPAVRAQLLARIAAARNAAPRSVAASHRRAGSGSLWRVALAAGVAGLLGAGIASAILARSSEQRDALRLEELEALQAEIAEAQDEIAELEASQRSLESDLVLANKTIMVLSSDEMQSLALAGTNAMPKAAGRVFWDWKNWYCYLHAEGFTPDPKRIYAMWLFTEDGNVIGVGTFHSDASGEAIFLAPVPHDVGHVIRAGVSQEPDEDIGSKPRGEVVMLTGL